jgi:hypothetical protein
MIFVSDSSIYKWKLELFDVKIYLKSTIKARLVLSNVVGRAKELRAHS